MSNPLIPDKLEFPKLKKATSDKMPKHSFICEQKLDGEALMLIEGGAWGRRISEVTYHRENKWDQLPPWIQKQAPLVRLVLGELHVLGGTSSDVKTALKEGRETNWKGDLCKNLHFCAHTLMYYNGKPLEHRDALKAMGFSIPRILFADNYKEGGWYLSSGNKIHSIIQPGHWTAEQFINAAKYEGIEGWVFKEVNNEATRHAPWWKLKVTWTYDCVVTGTKDGTGINYGDVGSLLVSMQEVPPTTPLPSFKEVASVSGMTMKERDWMTANRDKLKGRVCEVEANGVCSRGRLHHPRFVRWRDDKPASECTIDQLKQGE